MVRKENGGKTMKRSSKIKRLLSLTLAMACLFAVVAIPQVSAETADNPFVYVPAPNGGYVLSEVAAGEAAPRAALLSYYGIDFYHDKQFTVSVQVNGQVVGNGTGHTKKAAEQAAAYQAIQEKKF